MREPVGRPSHSGKVLHRRSCARRGDSSWIGAEFTRMLRMMPSTTRRTTGVTLAMLVLTGTAKLALAQPLQLPGAQPFNPAGTQQAAPGGGGPAKPRTPSMPAIKLPTEESILGRPLRHNGGLGQASFERLGSGYGLRLTADGFQSDNPTEPCNVSFGDGPVPVTPEGRPAGVPRYRLEAPVCPIVFDVLDGAFLVVEPTEPCIITAATCRIEPHGLWGPDSRTLAARTKEIESSRGAAERAVREGFKALAAKAEFAEQRALAREQAGFSSERELICRDFQREGSHGFCATRVTEAKAASIRSRLGLPEPKPEKPRSPRPPVARPAPLPAPAPTQ